jgi:hypothetical protein
MALCGDVCLANVGADRPRPEPEWHLSEFVTQQTPRGERATGTRPRRSLKQSSICRRDCFPKWSELAKMNALFHLRMVCLPRFLARLVLATDPPCHSAARRDV